jgi:hypothetical protein
MISCAYSRHEIETCCLNFIRQLVRLYTALLVLSSNSKERRKKKQFFFFFLIILFCFDKLMLRIKFKK